MHDWTNECGVSIGTQLIQEAGKGERVKLFLKFSLKVGVVKNLLLRPFQSQSILQGRCVLPRRIYLYQSVLLQIDHRFLVSSYGEASCHRQSRPCWKPPFCLHEIFWAGVLGKVSEPKRVCDKVLGTAQLPTPAQG